MQRPPLSMYSLEIPPLSHYHHFMHAKKKHGNSKLTLKISLEHTMRLMQLSKRDTIHCACSLVSEITFWIVNPFNDSEYGC